LLVTVADVSTGDQADAWFRPRKRQSLPKLGGSRADLRAGFPSWVLGINQFLTGREKVSLGAKGIGRLIPLAGGQGLAGARPTEREAHRRHLGPEPPARLIA